jgi:hypothetical protein
MLVLGDADLPPLLKADTDDSVGDLRAFYSAWFRLLIR